MKKALFITLVFELILSATVWSQQIGTVDSASLDLTDYSRVKISFDGTIESATLTALQTAVTSGDINITNSATDDKLTLNYDGTVSNDVYLSFKSEEDIKVVRGNTYNGLTLNIPDGDFDGTADDPLNLPTTKTIGSLNVENDKWNLITLPSGLHTNAKEIIKSNKATMIWGWDINGSDEYNWVAYPNRMEAGRGYWVKTRTSANTNGTLGDVVASDYNTTVLGDYASDEINTSNLAEIISKMPKKDEWVLLGNSGVDSNIVATSGSENNLSIYFFGDLLNATEECYFISIYHWNSATDSWVNDTEGGATTTPIPANAGMWVKQRLCDIGDDSLNLVIKVSGVIDDVPVEGAEVYIDFSDGTVSTKAITNSDGSYELKLSDEDLAKINPEIPEGADTPRDNLLLVLEKDGKQLRSVFSREVTDGQTIYITNDTEAYAQFLESIGQFNTITLTEFNKELLNGRIKDDSNYSTFIKDIREDVKTYFYGGEKLEYRDIFEKAKNHLGKERLSRVADDSSLVSVRSVMSGGDIFLSPDFNVTSDDIEIVSKGNGRYTLGDGDDENKTIYLQIEGETTFNLIPIEIKERVITQLAKELVTSQQGASFGDSTTDTISATIPPFALSEDKNITFNRVESAGETTDGKVILDMQPSGLTFDMPITVTINYGNFGIDDPNSVEWNYGSVEGGYESADIVSIDTINKLIYVSISHFSELIVTKKEMPLIIVKPFENGNLLKYNFNNKDYLNANNLGSHLGVDIMKTDGTDVLAVCNGFIKKSLSTLSESSRDKFIRGFVLECNEKFNNKRIYSVYFHVNINSDFEDVNSSLGILEDIQVLKNQKIATVVNWDDKTEGSNDHLHLGFTYATHRPQTKDTICIKKTTLLKEGDSEYEEGFIKFNVNSNDYTYFVDKDQACPSTHYKIRAGGGIASSTSLSKDLILPNNILTDLGWINPASLLGATSLVNYDSSYWSSSLSTVNNSTQYHVISKSLENCASGLGCWKTQEELSSALSLCATDCEANWIRMMA